MIAYSNITHTGKNVERTKCLSTDKWRTKMYYLYNGMLSTKHDRNDTCYKYFNHKRARRLYNCHLFKM